MYAVYLSFFFIFIYSLVSKFYSLFILFSSFYSKNVNESVTHTFQQISIFLRVHSVRIKGSAFKYISNFIQS